MPEQLKFERSAWPHAVGLLIAVLFLALPRLTWGAEASNYLPLFTGERWVLRHPSSPKPVTIEVQDRDGDSFSIRFGNPWGENNWRLQSRDGKIYMTGFGANGQLSPMPADTLFFDFNAPEGASWSNTIGKLTVVSRTYTVQVRGTTYSDCIQIRQASKGSNIVYAFAQGVGFVQFGDGKTAFTLDPETSTLFGDDRGPVQHVPGPSPMNPPPEGNPATVPRPGSALRDSKLHVGVTVNTFANEPQTPQNLLKHFDQAVSTGISFISAAQKWTEVETSPGKYDFGSIDLQVQYAERLNIPMSFTLRLIDTVDRQVPPDLRQKSWNDPSMQQRVKALIGAMAPHFRGRVNWFMFGNEIDGYFGRHPNEVTAYAELFRQVSARMKELSAGIQVSSTLQFGGISTLNGLLRPLNAQFEFVSFTYYPIRSDFTMGAPDSPYKDFALMKQAAAGRKVVLQEIGYSSSDINASSQEKQAQFYQAAFAALRKNRDFVEAGNFFLLADLPDDFVKQLAKFYGIPRAPTFLAFLQYLGMFDLNGRPKKSWDVFRQEIRK